ncbi:calcineurin-like phosphoesterase domain-containing protein [Phthorimaea operculella]|nr:calcineurin-like phosphoesterase domain-containing protein [Phthorimaea operculella]
MELQRAHATLKSPELAMFCQMAFGDQNKEDPLWQEFDSELLIEICEEDVLISAETGAGAVAVSSPNAQLLVAANYTRDDQIRLFSEFMTQSYPALYLSFQVFTNFMVDMGWQRVQCNNLFRAADLEGRGGLSFQEMLLWCAATEPGTQHGGIPAEIRCRYIFRYFDCNRDQKLEYVEFKELVAAARLARQLPIDALSVSRDADVILRQIGLQPNSQLPVSEFLRSVSEMRLRGTSSMLRTPRSVSAYLADLQITNGSSSASVAKQPAKPSSGHGAQTQLADGSVASTASERRGAGAVSPDYNVATYTVRVRKDAMNEMIELKHFDEEAVSPSTARLITVDMPTQASLDVLGPGTMPVEAMAAVHYFATPVEKLPGRRISVATNSSLVANKSAFSWAAPAEEQAMGALLLKLANAVAPICQAEPRLLRLTSPVYCIGDLHGNLSALLAVETALWPSGASISPAKLLFLGDFVDRGPHGTELMAYLLAAKLQRPKGVLMIRGNHETRDIQRMFTFHTECVQKYGDAEGSKIWNAINNVFDVLPLAAVIDDKVFCCHGGIPPPWVCPLITAIDKVPVPLTRPSEQSTIAWELLWNDPVKANKLTASTAAELTTNEGFAANVKRGTGHVFDQTAVDRFLLANQLSHVVRAHELHQNGFMVQLRGRVISVFSSSHYCGGTNDIGVALLEGSKLRLIRVSSDP